jgi:hypothetical protein
MAVALFYLQTNLYFHEPYRLKYLANNCYSCTYLIIISSKMIFIIFFIQNFFKPFSRNNIDTMPLTTTSIGRKIVNNKGHQLLYKHFNSPRPFHLIHESQNIEKIYHHTNSPTLKQEEHWITAFPYGCNDNIGRIGNISSPQCSNVNVMGHLDVSVVMDIVRTTHSTPFYLS